MQNVKVLLMTEKAVFPLSADPALVALPLVRYLRLYSSFNLLARALRFTTSILLRALGDTKRFLSLKARSPFFWEGLFNCLLTADMQVKLRLLVIVGLTTIYYQVLC